MRSFYKLLSVFLIVGFGMMIMVGLVRTKPAAQKKPVSLGAPLVEVMPAKLQDAIIEVSAMGTVKAASIVTVQPQVSGKIVWQSKSMVPGASVKKGETLVKVDARDYQLIVDQLQSQVAAAEVELQLELGRQAVAEREWELLGSEVETTEEGRLLALRKPQELTARAALKSAQAALQKAELDLSRTNIIAPFNALIQDESVDPGQMVTPGSPVAKLVGTDEFRIQASVSQSQLGHISIPGVNAKRGSGVKVMLDGGQRDGQVIGLMSDVDPMGRMARILISVKDPLALDDANSLPLLLGSYVNVQIMGREVEDVFVLPQLALHDSKVWVLDAEQRLSIRDINIVWARGEQAIVRGDIKEGEQIIASRISMPIDGMQLIINGAEQKDRLDPELAALIKKLELSAEQKAAVLPLLQSDLIKRKQIEKDGQDVAKELKIQRRELTGQLAEVLDKKQLKIFKKVRG